MNIADKQYQNLLQEILDNGIEKKDRTGTGTKSIFGTHMKFNLREGFPLLTTKKIFTKGVIHELLWFIAGNTNIKYLVDNNVHIWDDDAYRWYCSIIDKNNKFVEDNGILVTKQKYNMEYFYGKIEKVNKDVFLAICKAGNRFRYVAYESNNTESEYYFDIFTYGDLGHVYGKQWRGFGVENVDQIQNIIDTLKTNPDDRRMLCIAYNPDVINKVALPPCHVMFQFYTRELPNKKRELSCSWYQRSIDSPLGLPFNIASYALLTHMIAHVCDMTVGDLVFNGGDTHIYLNQIDGVKEQLQRDPDKYDSPTLWLNPEVKNINDFTFDDIKIIGYESYDTIKMPLSTGV